MKQIQIDKLDSLAPISCGHCGSLLRLVGSEPHPVQANTDLLTFSCTNCESLQVVVMPIPPLGS
jgi:hypothetical protein